MPDQMIKEIFVTNVVCNDEKKFGFARIIETGEDVFIPPHIIKGHNLEYGSRIMAELFPNDGNKHAKYKVNFVYDKDGIFAHLLKPLEFKEPEVKVVVSREPTRSEIYDWICDFINHNSSEIFTTSEMCDELEVSKLKYRMTTGTMGRDLDYLFKQGKIGKIQAFASPSNQRAMRTVWTSQLKAVKIFDHIIKLYERSTLDG